MPTTAFDLRRLLGASLAVVALGLGVTACGGGDDEEPAAPTATTTTTEEEVVLTKSSLIEQGDAICAEVNAALGSIESSTADDTTKSSQIADLYDGLAQRLADLGTPTDGEPPTDVIAAAQDLADGSTDSTELQDAASAYGFADCAEAPVTTSYSTDSSSTDSSSTGTDSTDTYVPPATETVPETTTPVVPTTPEPSTGGGVAPTPPDTGGSSPGSSGGSSSGGIGPG